MKQQLPIKFYISSDNAKFINQVIKVLEAFKRNFDFPQGLFCWWAGKKRASLSPSSTPAQMFEVIPLTHALQVEENSLVLIDYKSTCCGFSQLLKQLESHPAHSFWAIVGDQGKVKQKLMLGEFNNSDWLHVFQRIDISGKLDHAINFMILKYSLLDE